MPNELQKTDKQIRDEIVSKAMVKIRDRKSPTEPPQKDLVIEARAALAKMSNGTRIREAQLAPLLNESRELLRQLAD